MAEEKGVWRTIRGRRVFIRSGEDLESAMKRSGKFKMKITEEEKQNIEKNKYKDDRDTTNEEFIRDEIKQFIDGGNEKESFINFRDRMKETYGVEEDTFNKRFQHAEDNLYYEKTGQLPTEERKKTYSREARAREIDKINEGTPLQDIANDRIKEKETTLENDKIMLEGMKRKGISEIQGWEQKDFENRIAKNEEYLSTAKTEETVKLPDGTPIDQNYIKDLYSGMSYEEVKRANDFDKEWMANVKPEAKAMQTAKVEETDKYLASMERYESRISDEEYGKKDWGDNVYPFSEGTAWKGTKSGERLSTKEIAKAVTDKMKEAYPGVKIGRNTSYYSGGSSADFYITSSDKPIVRDISDFSQTEISRLYNKGYNSNWYKTEEDFKASIEKELRSGHFSINPYYIDDDYRLTPYGKQVIKDLRKVSDAYNYDESDGMTDYFNTGFYSDISIGRYNKPFVQGENVNKKTEAQVERFKERKGKSNSIENLSKRELAEKIVENQISRGMSFNNKENVINSKMKMTKEELLKYFK